MNDGFMSKQFKGFEVCTRSTLEMSSASSTSKNEKSQYLFFAKAKEAFVIKILSELLYNANIKWAPFRIDIDGIHLSQADASHQQLFIFSLKREHLHQYRAVQPLSFLVSCSNLYRMLKSIKKKDSITLFIKADDESKLGICVETSDENNQTNTKINITYNQPMLFTEPSGYPSATIVNNKEFQKMKNLHNMAKDMQVTCPYPGLIKFYCDAQDICEREVVLGQEIDEEYLDEGDHEEFKATFTTPYITGLTKCANQSGQVHLFVHKDLPLKIKMRAGSLGDLTVYIKSQQRIALEEKAKAELREVAKATASLEETEE